MRNAEAVSHKVAFKLTPEEEASTFLSSSLGLFLQYSGWRRVHAGTQLLRNHARLSEFLTGAQVIQRKSKNTDNFHVPIFNSELLQEMKSVWHKILQRVSVCEGL